MKIEERIKCDVCRECQQEAMGLLFAAREKEGRKTEVERGA